MDQFDLPFVPLEGPEGLARWWSGDRAPAEPERAARRLLDLSRQARLPALLLELRLYSERGEIAMVGDALPALLTDPLTRPLFEDSLTLKALVEASLREDGEPTGAPALGALNSVFPNEAGFACLKLCLAACPDWASIAPSFDFVAGASRPELRGAAGVFVELHALDPQLWPGADEADRGRAERRCDALYAARAAQARSFHGALGPLVVAAKSAPGARVDPGALWSSFWAAREARAIEASLAPAPAAGPPRV